MTTNKTCILFRKSLSEESEIDVAKKYFDVYENRTSIPSHSTVIGRYSVLPYYKELENDLAVKDCTLINSYTSHNYIANMQNWYEDLKDFTPKTWFSVPDIDEEGPFILKGETSSRKQLFTTHMYAPMRQDVMDVYGRLLDDSLLQHQKICVRKFVELENYGKDCITGMPIAKEFRCFFWKKKLLCKGFYWQNHVEVIGHVPDNSEVPGDLLDKVSDIVANHADFYVVDVAKTLEGKWIVIELNDGGMSGLSCNDPGELYSNLRKATELEDPIKQCRCPGGVIEHHMDCDLVKEQK
jgi:hypothetical protein